MKLSENSFIQFAVSGTLVPVPFVKAINLWRHGEARKKIDAEKYIFPLKNMHLHNFGLYFFDFY